MWSFRRQHRRLMISARMAGFLCGSRSMRFMPLAVKSSVPTTSLTGCWLQRKSCRYHHAGCRSRRVQDRSYGCNESRCRKFVEDNAFLHQHGIGPLVMMAMGEWGKTTRVAAGRYGSCITFAAGQEASAPGQVDVFTMLKWLNDYYGEE